MAYLDWFDEFLKECSQQKIQCVPLRLMAEQLLENKQNIPILPLIQGQIDGRSGTLAMHG
jgi:hypothetical protein